MIGTTQVKAHWNTYEKMERFPFEISTRMFVSHQFLFFFLFATKAACNNYFSFSRHLDFIDD